MSFGLNFYHLHRYLIIFTAIYEIYFNNLIFPHNYFKMNMSNYITIIIKIVIIIIILIIIKIIKIH